MRSHSKSCFEQAHTSDIQLQPLRTASRLSKLCGRWVGSWLKEKSTTNAESEVYTFQQRLCKTVCFHVMTWTGGQAYISLVVFFLPPPPLGPRAHHIQLLLTDLNFFPIGNVESSVESCSHTAADGAENPWWRVDLGQSYAIDTVKITNRGDCCGWRLSNIEIRIGDTLDDENGGTANPKISDTPFGVREHLISSQFFSKRNAFQIGFTPSLPPLSERLIAHFLTIIDVVRPQDLVHPRRNCSERVSCPSPQEKLQPTTSSPLLPRFHHSPSLSMHRLLCAWPPPQADRDCRQRKHLQTSHNGWMENGMDPLFWLQVFQKGSAVETSWTPPHNEKILSCNLPVPVRKVLFTCNSKSTVMFSCTLGLALGRRATAPARSGHERDRAMSWGPRPRPARPMPRGALRRLDRLAYAGYGRSPRLVDLPGFEQWQSWTLALDPNFESFFKINFPFLWKMCDLWFSIRN